MDQRFEGGAVEFRDSLAKYAIACGFEYNFERNDKVRVTAFCKDVDCKWRIHARLERNGDLCSIRSYDDIHTCGVGALTTKHSRVSCNLIGRLMNDGNQISPFERPCDVVVDLKKLYGVDVPYKRTWVGVQKREV